jgi:hypothetical protein
MTAGDTTIERSTPPVASELRIDSYAEGSLHHAGTARVDAEGAFADV